MKLYSLTVAAVALASAALMSPATAAAPKCTEKQVDFLYNMDFTVLNKVCTSIFVDDKEIDASNSDTITAQSLKGILPCKASTCRSELASTVAITPNCEDEETNGTNYNRMYTAFLELCNAFSEGDVSVAEARTIVQDVYNSDASDSATPTTKPTATTKKPSTPTPTTTAPATKAPATTAPVTEETPATTKAEAATSATTTPSPSLPAATPAPSSAPTSHASTTATTGAAVVTSATLVASLLL